LGIDGGIRCAFPPYVLSPPLTTPKDRILEQYRMVGELVMPHFRSRPAMHAAAAK
jgi:hypothetical protein